MPLVKSSGFGAEPKADRHKQSTISPLALSRQICYPRCLPRSAQLRRHVLSGAACAIRAHLARSGNAEVESLATTHTLIHRLVGEETRSCQCPHSGRNRTLARCLVVDRHEQNNSCRRERKTPDRLPRRLASLGTGVHRGS